MHQLQEKNYKAEVYASATVYAKGPSKGPFLREPGCLRQNI